MKSIFNLEGSCHRNSIVEKYGELKYYFSYIVTMAAEGGEAETQQKDEAKRHTYPLVRVRK